MKYSVSFVKKLVEKYMIVNQVSFLGNGNHSDAFLINNEMVIKLPRHDKANECIIKEIILLEKIENLFDLNIPNVLFKGQFEINKKSYSFFISKKLEGRKLNKVEFNKIPQVKLDKLAYQIAKFLYQLHTKKDVFKIITRDYVLLHGDFSLGHILFDEDYNISGILDFADSRIGMYKRDFIYLLDDEDDEEFGIKFGKDVLEKYLLLRKE